MGFDREKFDAAVKHGFRRLWPGCAQDVVAECYGETLIPPGIRVLVQGAVMTLNDAPPKDDALWSSNVARAKGLRRLTLAQLGCSVLDPVVLAERVIVGLTAGVIATTTGYAAFKDVKTPTDVVVAITGYEEGVNAKKKPKAADKLCLGASATLRASVSYYDELVASGRANVEIMCGLCPCCSVALFVQGLEPKKGDERLTAAAEFIADVLDSMMGRKTE